MTYDFCIIGAGIVGLSTAMQILQRYPGASLVLLEKEDAPAKHQTGRNSGVIHAGVYYAPGSLKAQFCRAGLTATIAFCRENNVPYDQCGKLIVATSAIEAERLGALEQRARRNGLDVVPMSREELREREPEINALQALLVKDTGIVDYPAMCRAMADKIIGGGGEIIFSSACQTIHEEADKVTITTTQKTITARQLVVCGGLQADRLAKKAGLKPDFQIVPFRGDYFRLAARCNTLTRHLIYPVPDPDLPFLGVHLTRMIGGYITIGPNACLALARENYSRYGFNLRDMLAMAGFKGLWHVLWQNRHSAADELRSSFSRKHYLELCRKYCPGLTLDDLQPYPSGIRAQAVTRKGELIHDFLIMETKRMVHICNAPSPAATAALPIGRHLVDLIEKRITG